jgi:hypothetical protein
VPLDTFNITDGTPIQIKSLANGSIHSDMAAIVNTDTTTTTFYGPDVSWDNFIESQPYLVESSFGEDSKTLYKDGRHLLYKLKCDNF